MTSSKAVLRPLLAATVVATALLPVGLPTVGAFGLVRSVIAADPTLSPDPSVGPTLDPTVPPPATASPSPTDAPPTPAPDPSATPTDSPQPLPDPIVIALPTATTTSTASMSPSPTDLLAWSLTPGQRSGSEVGAPLPRYPLVSVAAPLAVATQTPHEGAADFGGPDCAVCHASHTAKNIALLDTPQPQSNQCFACHGQGATFDVRTPFVSAPPNDASTASYYAHPVSDGSASSHVLSSEDEFGGVANRHAVCADCHNPHDASSQRPVQLTTGWTASGDVKSISRVTVTNGAAATAPAYGLVLRDADATSPGYEYELCLKCHSGWTTLPTRSTTNPSWWALDKGIEFNPANAAYHPVEARGKNLTAQLATNLAGTSPFKAWNLTVDSTVRCTMCHGDPTTVNQAAPAASPKTPSADAYEASHASPNRGILTAPYRDRVLKPAGEAYNANDFALCYLCHAERPYTDPNENPSSADTAFSLHGMHLTNIRNRTGVGSSIDKKGDGGGFAVCAECHFRIHSTAESYQTGDTAPVARSTGATSLVNFAPDVAGPVGSSPIWTKPTAQGTGSCTLTCHGFTHTASQTAYSTAPGTGFWATPTSGSVGLTGLPVQFVDATRYATPATATWLWDFGDGTTSTAQSPLHVYASPNTYTVTLTVTRSGGLSTTMTRSSYITVYP